MSVEDVVAAVQTCGIREIARVAREQADTAERYGVATVDGAALGRIAIALDDLVRRLETAARS